MTKTHKVSPTWFGLPRPVFNFRDDDHTPFNKRHGQVKSVATAEILHHRGNADVDAWLSINLSEITTSDNGRVASRTIAVTLDKNSRAALLAMLNSEED